MKKLAGLVIILAALVLGGYYGMGVLTENAIRRNIEVMNQSNGLHAKIEKYDRGLFRSQATLQWDLQVPERVVTDANGKETTVAAQSYQMDMPLTIHHGPVILADNKVRFGLGYAETVVAFPEKYNAQFDETFTKESAKPQVDLSIFVNYKNESILDVAIPAFNLFFKEGNKKFEWSGLNANIKTTSDLKTISGTTEMEGIHFSKDDIKFDLNKAITDYNLHETALGLYLGDANFTLPSLNVLEKDRPLVQVANFVVQSNSDIEQNLFNSHFKVTMKSLVVDGKNYGPGEFELALRNLNAEILAKINEQAKAVQNASEAQRQQAMIALLPDLPKLFSQGAELEISKLNLVIPDGTINGSLFIALPKEDHTNPFELLQKVHGSAKLKMPAITVKTLMKQSILDQMTKQPELQQSLVQQLQAASQPALTTEQLATMQTEKQLTAMQQNGLITAQGSDYLIEVSLEQGKFTVNGKPFDSSMLKF